MIGRSEMGYEEGELPMRTTQISQGSSPDRDVDFASRISEILPPLHNRTHKTTLGGMVASVSQALDTFY